MLIACPLLNRFFQLVLLQGHKLTCLKLSSATFSTQKVTQRQDATASQAMITSLLQLTTVLKEFELHND